VLGDELIEALIEELGLTDELTEELAEALGDVLGGSSLVTFRAFTAIKPAS